MTVLLEAKPSAELEDVRPRVEVLFAEARQRGRRRRAIYVILGSFVAITLLVVVAIVVPPLLAPHGTAKGTPGSPAGALGAVTSMVITAESLDLVTANGDVVERLRYTDSPEQFRNVLTSLLGRPVISPNPWPRPSAVLRWTGLGFTWATGMCLARPSCTFTRQPSRRVEFRSRPRPASRSARITPSGPIGLLCALGWPCVLNTSSETQRLPEASWCSLRWMRTPWVASRPRYRRFPAETHRVASQRSITPPLRVHLASEYL